MVKTRTLNVALKAAIFATGKSQRAIALKAQVYETRLSQIINGRVQPTDDEKKRLARTLKAAQSELFGSEAA